MAGPRGMGQSAHSLTLLRDSDDWDYAECSCGWVGPPCPDAETAAEFWGDHREDGY